MQHLPWAGWCFFLSVSLFASRQIHVPLIPIDDGKRIYYADVKNIGEVDQTVTIEVIAHPRFELDPQAWKVLYGLNSYNNALFSVTNLANSSNQPGGNCSRYGAASVMCYCPNPYQSLPALRGGGITSSQSPFYRHCAHAASLTCTSGQKCSQNKVLRSLEQTHVQFTMRTIGNNSGQSYYLYLRVGVQEDQGQLMGKVLQQSYYSYSQGGPLLQSFWEHGQFDMNGGRPF